MNDKVILIGEVQEDVFDTPIRKFKKAIHYSKMDRWVVRSNDPQFIEALEVLCDESNVDVFLVYDGRLHMLSFREAYDYVGDVYSIINLIRFNNEINDVVDYDMIKNEIKDYEKKWSFI